MERAQAICGHPLWVERLNQLKRLEADRAFCRHTPEHFLDVARIAQIENLERDLGVPREWIYAAALLHDIGRAAQYLDGTPHERASAELSRVILADCGFTEAERAEIVAAIVAHRNPQTRDRDDLAGLIYRADKASRLCLFCPAEAECNWSKEKKNLTITV